MIGFVRCECLIYHAQSLKEKRGIIKSITSRIKQRLNVSIAELEHQDLWQRTTIGIATVANSKKRAEQELQKALKLIETKEQVEIISTDFEWL